MLDPDIILQNRYRIVGPLGQGGMGTVYQADDQRFNSTVALKETSFVQPSMRKAFEHEAGLLNRLRHPALPVVMDYFTEGQKQYLVMQFIPGKDLAQLLAERKQSGRGPFPVELALQWADRLLDALEYLHGHHPPIVHRDIKPANLKLTPRDEIVLLDFGLAKGGAAGMAQAGSLYGYSPHYAPLEQMEGTGTEPRSDLYALAATLHCLLTGQMPPKATERATVRLLGKPDPLRSTDELNPRVPVAVAKVLARALAQHPDERPETAIAMRSALRAASQPLHLHDIPGLHDEPELKEELTPTLIYDSEAGRRAKAPKMLDGKTILDTQPAEEQPLTLHLPARASVSGAGRKQVQFVAQSPVWLIFSILFFSLAVGLTIAISRRFLSGAPDLLGFSITFALGLLCLLGGSAFTSLKRFRAGRDSSRLGVWLKSQAIRRLGVTLILLLFVSALYLRLPAIARLYNKRAVQFQQAGDLPAAIRNGERAINLDPNYAVAHYNLASAYEEVLEYEKAFGAYQAALRADPKFYFTYNNLARLYLLQRKDFANALKILNAALELEPPEPPVKYTLYKNRGWAHFGLGFHDLAEDDLREALRWREDGASAHCLLAQTLKAKGENEMARQSWQACMIYASYDPDVEASWLSHAQEILGKEKH